MSVPIQPISCTNCDFAFEDYGKPLFVLYAFPDGSEIHGSRTLGWCSKCNGIQNIESGNAASHLREALNRLEAKSLRAQIGGLWRKFSGNKTEQVCSEVEITRERLRLAQQRTSRARCLHCGSEDCQPLTFGTDRLSSTFLHSCGGRLRLDPVDESIQFAYNLEAVRLDVDGNLISGPTVYRPQWARIGSNKG